MSVDPRLLEILVCPACHAGIDPLPGQEGLACRGCGLVYPVRDGIPVMLVEEATPRGDRTGSGDDATAPSVEPS